jgi:O-antigen ligase
MDIATGYRWSTHWRIRPIQPFGYGYNLTNFYHGIPHNIILIIIEQIGLVGLAAWLVATAYCIKVSRRWYLWGTFLALGVVDHYSWTQIAPWYFAMVGISEAHRQKSANIFKGEEWQSVKSAEPKLQTVPLTSPIVTDAG